MLLNSKFLQPKKLRKFFVNILCVWLAAVAVIAPHSAYALYDGPRSTSYSNYRCDVGSIDFQPFGESVDATWVISNPTCAGFVASSGAALFAAEYVVAYGCLKVKHAAEVSAQVASGVPMSPKAIKRRAKEAAQCSSLMSEQSYGQAVLCCTGLASASIAMGLATAALALIWDQANQAFKNARICGEGWSQWAFDEENDAWVKIKGPHLLCLENLFLQTDHPNVADYCLLSNSRSIANKSYREFIYGGVEFEDNVCKNPTTWNYAKKIEILGYASDNQRYYMTGSQSAGVYACYRFLAKAESEEDRVAMKASYDCCRQRSQETLCIENRSGILSNLAVVGNNLAPTVGTILGGPSGATVGAAAGFGVSELLDEAGVNTNIFSVGYEHEFCKIGSRCNVGDIVFEIYESRQHTNYACARTYSVCPYDHLLGGGTEVKQENEKDPSKIDNFCQYLKHCAKLPILPRIYHSDLNGGFISSACRDLKGDSQNVYGYSAQLLPINTRGFSAPMAQCFKETMENIFLHKAGHTKCIDPNEEPINDFCVSGYQFKKNGDLPGESFFVKIQNNLRDVVKMALVVSVVIFGFAILLAVPNMHINKKVLLGYLLKIGLVMYFAVGDAWQSGFVSGIIGSSNFLAELVFKVDEDLPPDRLDGCQFPRFNYQDENPASKYRNPQYPPGKEYLRIWDTLDCKIARALGFGPEVSVPNLILSIIGGLFTGGLGIVFFVMTFVFAFFLISLTIKALHVFILSITSIIILLYVSPVTITLAFFEKTKNIFSGWLKQLLGFALQPMILFAYLGILVTLLDYVILGSATFKPSIVEVDGVQFEDTYGRITPKIISCSGDANDDSLYCIFRISDIKTFNGFEPLGLGIPMLASMNSAKLSTIFKAAILMFIFSSFMDKITEVAAKLVGGAELKPSWGMSSGKMMIHAFAAARAVQSRGINAVNKYLNPITGEGKAWRVGAKKIGKAAKFVLNKGKSLSPIERISGQNSVGSSSRTLGADAPGNSLKENNNKGDENKDHTSSNKGHSSGSGDGTGKSEDQENKKNQQGQDSAGKSS